MTVSSHPRVERFFLPSHRKRLGFSLIELLVVVLIVGIVGAAAAPSITRSMAIGRTNRCLHDIARLFRYARTNAIASGRAHLVVWQDADGGRFATFAGDSSSCARSWWEMIVAKDQPIDVVPLDEYETRSQGHGIEVSWRILGGLALAPAGALQATCFEPDGRRFDRFTGNGAFVPTQGAVVVEVVRMENGANAGDPLRRVMIPEFGGASVWQ